MPFELRKRLKKGERKTVFEDEDGQKLKIVYNPNFTPALNREIRQFIAENTEGDENEEFLVRWLAHVLVSWDLVLDGEPVGTEEPSLAGLPTTFLAAICEHITDDIGPNAGSGGPSAAG